MYNLVNLSILVIYIFLLFFTLVIPFFYIRYIDRLKLQKCECSEGFNRKFVYFYSAFVYIFIITVVFTSFFIKQQKINGVLNSETHMVMSTGLSFLFAFCLYHYQKKVYDTNCQCAKKSWEPKVMKIHSYVLGILVFISILNIISIISGQKKITDNFDNNMVKSLKKFRRKIN